jgi:hypothetical protein
MKLIALIAVTIAVLFHGIGEYLTDVPVDEVSGSSGFSAPAAVQEILGPNWSFAFPALVLSFCTILGVTAEILWSKSKEGTKKLSAKDLSPLLISPIVLYSTFAVAKDHPDAFIAGLMAFQNGFFWQAIFRVASRSTTAADDQK